MMLALFLCVERRKAEKSVWAPYIKTLPRDSPCGWMPGSKPPGTHREGHQRPSSPFPFHQVFKSQGRRITAGQQISKSRLRQSSKATLETISKTARELSTALKITAADLQWAYGMVRTTARLLQASVLPLYRYIRSRQP